MVLIENVACEDSWIYVGMPKLICINNGLKVPIQLHLQNKVRLPNDATSFFLRVNKHRPNFQQYRVIHLEASVKTPKTPKTGY